MASLTVRKGKRVIQFSDSDGYRRTLYLGKMDKSTATGCKLHIEHLLASKAANAPIPNGTAIWLKELGDTIHSNLSGFGLVARREAMPTIESAVNRYFADRPEIKPVTKAAWTQGSRSLLEYFGSDKRVDKITPDDAKAFRGWLITAKLTKAKNKLAGSTAHKRLRFAKALFRGMVEDGLLSLNPFAKTHIKTTIDESRNVYVTAQQTYALMEACPDAEMRLLLALCRWGGLRNPCETHVLKWSNIDRQAEEIRLISPKTNTPRSIPIFPELKRPLDEAYEQARDGAVYVIDKNRGRADSGGSLQSHNLRTAIMRIQARAGLPSWPKQFHALRASMVTDLVEQGVPIRTAAEWLGHSPEVMAKHYLRASKDCHAKAVRGDYSKPLNVLQNVLHPMSEIRSYGESAKTPIATFPSNTHDDDKCTNEYWAQQDSNL